MPEPRLPRRSRGARTSPMVGHSRSLPPAFAVPAYRWYWGSQLASGIGTWAQTVAQAWLVLQLTNSAIALGVITTLQFLPMLVFPLLSGVVADRLPRRQVLVVTQVGAMVQAIALGLLVWSGQVQFWQVGVLALALGLSNAFGNPAQQALVPELVGRELLGNAVALNSVQFNVARLLGGAVGGTLVGVLGVAATLFLNAATFLPAIAVLLAIRPAYARPPSAREGADPGARPQRITADIGAGLRYALGNRPIRRVLALFGVVGLLGFNWSVATPLLAYTLGAGPAGFGAMQASLGAGSLLAGLVLMRTRVATERRFLVGAVTMGAVLILLGLSPWFGASLALMFFGGLGGVTASVTANTRLQLLSVDAYRGRVMSLFTLLIGGTSPVGSLLIGGIAQAAGIQTGVMVFGACLILGLVLILAVDRTPAVSVERAPA
jgi:MFS family permease